MVETATSPVSGPSGTGAPSAPQVQGQAGADVTSAQPAAGAGAAGGVQSSGGFDVEALLKDAGVREELERRLVKPAISKLEFNRKELEARIEQDVRARLTTEQGALQEQRLVERAKAGDVKAKAELADLRVAQYDQAQAAYRQQLDRQRLESDIAKGLVRDVLGIEADLIPPDALANPEALRKWSLSQSSYVRQEVEAAVRQARSEAGVVSDAAQAAQFGAKLASTPAPNFGSDSGSASSTPPMTQDEWNRGRGNRQWRRENAARITAGLRAGLITS